MYAYVDGESSVSAGVYFFYVLSQELRQICVSILDGLPEDLHNLLRIHRSTAGLPSADDVLQLAFADSEPVHLFMQLGEIVEAVQNRSQPIAKFCVDAGELCTFCGQIRRGVVYLIGDPLRLSLKIRIGKIVADGFDDLPLQPVSIEALAVAGVGAVLIAANIIAGLDPFLVARGVADIGPPHSSHSIMPVSR